MSQVIKSLVFILFGLALGVWIGRSSAPKPLEPLGVVAKLESLNEKFSRLGEQDLDQYYKTDSQKTRCEKADELLGKMFLIALADLGLRISEHNAKQVAASASGAAARNASPDPSPTSSAGELQRNESDTRSHYEIVAERKGLPVVSPSPANSQRPKPAGYVSWGTPVLQNQGWKPCRTMKDQWYITGTKPEDYRVGILPPQDGQEAEIAFIEALHDKNRPEEVFFDRCLNPPFQAGKKIRFRAQVKAAKIRDYANLHIRAYGPQHKVITRATKNFRGDIDKWINYSVELEIPLDTSYINYGITMESTGKAWIKDVVIEMI